MKKINIFVLSLLASISLPTAAQIDSTALTGNKFVDQTIDVGANKVFTRAQSTASVFPNTCDGLLAPTNTTESFR